MSRLLIAIAIAGCVSLVAALFKRGSKSDVVSVKRNALPTRVPAVEVGLDAAPAIIVFTEATCDSCQMAVRIVRGPAGAGIPVADIEYGADPALTKSLLLIRFPQLLSLTAKEMFWPDGQGELI